MSKLGYRDMVFDPRAVCWVKPLPKIQPIVTPRHSSARVEDGIGVPFEVYSGGVVLWRIKAPNEALAWIQVDRLCLQSGYDRRAAKIRRERLEEGCPAGVVAKIPNEALVSHVRAALLAGRE